MRTFLLLLLAVAPLRAQEQDMQEPPEAAGAPADTGGDNFYCELAKKPTCGDAQKAICVSMQKWKCEDLSKICEAPPPQCGDEQERTCVNSKWKCVDKPKCEGKQPRCAAPKILVCQKSGLWSCQRDPSKPKPKRIEKVDPVK